MDYRTFNVRYVIFLHAYTQPGGTSVYSLIRWTFVEYALNLTPEKSQSRRPSIHSLVTSLDRA